MSFVISSPPEASVNHPSNIYPLLVAVGSVPTFLSFSTFLFGSSDVPPFPLNVTSHGIPRYATLYTSPSIVSSEDIIL